MSNMYKDWMWDTIQEVCLERGLVDKIVSVYPDPSEGIPHYVEGYKNGQRVKYYVRLDKDEGWLCEHRELEPFDKI